MNWWAWFLAGAAAMYLLEKFLLRYALSKMSGPKASAKAMRRDLFGKMKYDSLLRVKDALDAELAERERPMV